MSDDATATAPAPASTPYRVVDAQDHGWYLTRDGYSPDLGGSAALPYGITWEQLVATRSPLRPVVPAPPADVAELQDALRAAGRKAVTTLAAALATLYDFELSREWDKPEPEREYERAMRVLVAGRGGSWESSLLREFTYFGRDVAAKPKRVDADAKGRIARVLDRWVHDPAGYVEVAETLAAIVSGIADEHGPDGWKHVADQWLQPGGMAEADTRVAVNLLHSQSPHHQPL